MRTGSRRWQSWRDWRRNRQRWSNLRSLKMQNEKKINRIAVERKHFKAKQTLFEAGRPLAAISNYS